MIFTTVLPKSIFYFIEIVSILGYSSLCHALSSQGYVVAAVEHNDGSAAATKTNGSVKFYERKPDKRYWRSQLVTRVEEVNIVIRNLRLLAARNGHWMKDRLDFSDIGMVGHHLGGATALAVCMRYDSSSQEGSNHSTAAAATPNHHSQGTRGPSSTETRITHCVMLTPSMKVNPPKLENNPQVSKKT